MPLPARKAAAPTRHPSSKVRSGMSSGHRALEQNAQHQESRRRDHEEDHQWMGEHVAAEGTPPRRSARTQGRPPPSGRTTTHACRRHDTRGLSCRFHIDKPLSAKYLSAPGCHGIGELFLS